MEQEAAEKKRIEEEAKAKAQKLASLESLKSNNNLTFNDQKKKTQSPQLNANL